MKNQQALGESGEEDGGSFSRKKLTEPESGWAAALARITGKYRNKGKLCTTAHYPQHYIPMS